MRYLWLCGLLLTGCVNLDIQLAPDDPAVKSTLIGEDCAQAIFLPLLIGTLTIDEAKRNVPGPEFGHQPVITTVHSLRMTQFGVPFYSEACLKVTEE